MKPASILIPTRARLDYLEVALASICPQAAHAGGVEVVVIDDAGASARARSTVEALGARYVPHPLPLGLNAARNTGVAATQGELVVFVDDDVRAAPGWLAALLAGAREHPGIDVFTGPIRARLEGRPPRSCGREAPPITTLDLGGEDRLTAFAWGANMAIRRAALELVGPFDPSLVDGGDEQEWQERLRAQSPPGEVLYVARAAVEHRRTPADSTLRALSRVAYLRGAAARRFDARRGDAPPLGRELLTLAGCAGHVARRRCPAAITMVAHSAGRVQQAMRGVPAPGAPGEAPAPYAPEALGASGAPGGDDFLSGSSGTVGGVDSVRRRLTDRALDAVEIAGGRRRRLSAAARASPPRRRVLILGVERPEHAQLARAMRAELMRSRHDVALYTRPPGELGKFENLDLLLEAHPPGDSDWLMVIDDDVVLPHGFLDVFLFLSERFSLALAQPAHRLDSHAAWQVTRRQPGSVARETSFVEIGPVTAFARETFPVLLPFPPLRMGWGLDAHWGALAREHGWRMGIVDAVAIGHRAAPAAASYARAEAVSEAREFLAGRAYVSAAEAQRTLATHRSW